MEPIKGDGVVVEFRGKFIVHTGHCGKGFLRFSEETWTLSIYVIFINLRAKYVHTQNTQKTTKDPKASD